MLKIISASIFFLLVGCASTENIKRINISSQIINFPETNIEAEAEIGQTIVSKSNLTILPAITIDKDVSETIKQSLMNNRHSGTTTIHAGTYKKTSENPDGSFFPDDAGVFDFMGGKIKWPIGIFVPNDLSKPAVMFTYHQTMGATGFEFGVTPLQIKKTTVQQWGMDSLKKELIYGGLSQKTISISYREFSDGTARPAFTQEIKYDLTDGDVIGFRGARFKIIKASNILLKYKVLKPLD